MSDKAVYVGGVRVSEHAMLRWFERKYGVDCKDVAEDMIKPWMVEAIKTCGSGHVHTSDGMVLVVVKGCVVTVVPEKEGRRGQKRQRAVLRPTCSAMKNKSRN